MYNDYLGLADDGGLGGGGDLVPRAGGGFLFLLLLVVLDRENEIIQDALKIPVGQY